MKLFIMLKTNKELRIIVMMLFLAVAAYVVGSISGDRSKACAEAGGTWLKKYRECENVNLGQCFNMGGIYNFCASPCRHYAEEYIVEACEMECLKVCEFLNPFKK